MLVMFLGGCVSIPEANTSLGFNEAIEAVEAVFSDEKLNKMTPGFHKPKVSFEKSANLYSLEFQLYQHKYMHFETTTIDVHRSKDNGCYIAIKVRGGVLHYYGKRRNSDKEKEYLTLILKEGN